MKDFLNKTAKWFIISIIATIILTDIILLLHGYTISEIMQDLESFDGLWCLPFFGSMFIGHWWIHFWKEDNLWTKKLAIYRYIALVVLGVLTILLNTIILTDVYIPWYLTVSGGLIVGALLWPQLGKDENVK